MVGGTILVILSIILPHIAFAQVRKLEFHCYCGIPIVVLIVSQLLLGVSLGLLDYAGAKGTVKDNVKKAHKVISSSKI
jgi:hypothetical protein